MMRLLQALGLSSPPAEADAEGDPAQPTTELPDSSATTGSDCGAAGSGGATGSGAHASQPSDNAGASFRFEVDDPRAYEHFAEQGYVVIASALEGEETGRAVDLFWNWYETVTSGQVRRDSTESWGGSAWCGQKGNGITGFSGIGQSEFMWFVRTRPRVLSAFARIWGVKEADDLLVSFDGCGTFRPPTVNPTWRTKGGWFHTDQNGCFTGSDFKCAQGLVTLYDQDATTGGFAVIPGSHKDHANIFSRWPQKRTHDFFIVPREDPVFASASPRIVTARAGDLIIWDSRCLHCNVPAWHRFDDLPLPSALAEAGLADATSEDLCEEFKTVAEILWLCDELSRGGTKMQDAYFLNAGVSENRVEALSALCTRWGGELARDLLEQGRAAGRAQPARLSRLVAYVCALPRHAVSPQVLAARRKAAVLGATTTHWPDRVVLCSLLPDGQPGFVDVTTLGPTALRLIGCESPGDNAEALVAEMRRTLEEVETQGRSDVVGEINGVR